MKHLISREDYINEYFHVSVEITNDNELYEGLLNTVFGGLKMLLKKDWEGIRCKNPTVLSYLKDIDKNLSGYTMTKMQFYSECNNIRQNIADYFNDILDYKLLQIEKAENIDKFVDKEEKEIEENTNKNSVSKLLNLKDDTLLDSIKKYKENISISCKKSPKLREYADQMLNSVVVFVNDIVIKELENKGVSKEKLEKKRKKNEEEQNRIKEIQDKMNELAQKASDDAIKKLSKKRDEAMIKIGVSPIGAMSGDKSVETISKQFKNMMSEFDGVKLNESASLPKGLEKILMSDTYIGIKQSFEEIDMDFSENDGESIKNKLLLKVILNKINTVYGRIFDNKNIFKEVPSASVQAMMIGLCNAVIYGFVGNKFKISDDRLSILTRCAIDSDATIGFNLPLIDPKKPDNGNFFVGVMNQFKNDDISSKEIEDVIKNFNKKELKQVAKNDNLKIKDVSQFTKDFSSIIMKDFRQNITKLFDIIVKKANEIKDAAEKEREGEASRLKEES